MERENVKKVLRYYNDIDGHILFARRKLQDYEDKFYSLRGGFGGISSNTNKISSPTEAAALNIPDSASRHMAELRANIEQLYRLQADIFTEICKLPLVEKNIIVDFYIKRRQWVQISRHAHYSETRCKQIRNNALDKLGVLFDNNELIKNFNYPE